MRITFFALPGTLVYDGGMETLLSELLRMITSGQVRLQPYTLIDADRPAIEARIEDWLRRASVAIMEEK